MNERQARRTYRRACEGHLQASHGRPNLVLKQQLFRSLPDARQALEQGDWAMVENIAYSGLKDILRNNQQKIRYQWKKQVSDFSAACKWVRKTAPPPLVLEAEDGRVTFGKTEGLDAISKDWMPLFQCSQDHQNDWTKYKDEFREFLPDQNCSWSKELSVDLLLRAAKKIKKTASGPDGWSAALLLALPTEAWHRLTQVLEVCENCGAWPRALLVWRVVFLPKEPKNGIPCKTMKLRPISVGPVLYRIWASLRTREAADQFQSRLLPPQQVAIQAQIDVATKGLEWGVSLDFEKAFDRSSWRIALEILMLWGLPSKIASALRYQWTKQQRIPSLSGAVLTDPIQNCSGLPQGDPWSPLALQAYLAPALQALTHRVPGSHFLYMDDRTSFLSNQLYVNQVLEFWRKFEEISPMKNNNSKTQIWELKNPVHHGFVLGMTFGNGSLQSAQETERYDVSLKIGQRIRCLPTSTAVRCAVSSAMVAAKAVWNQGITGRFLPTKELQTWQQACRKTCMSHPGGRASRPLEQILRFGHTSDLVLFACQRFLSSLNDWYLRELPIRCAEFPTLTIISKKLSFWGWRPQSWGKWVQQNLVIDVRQPRDVFSLSLHRLRNSWRHKKFDLWLESRTRRDSRIAREANITYSETLFKKLRDLTKALDGDAIAVMVGGCTTPATTSRQNRPSVCPYCLRCRQSLISCGYALNSHI